MSDIGKQIVLQIFLILLNAFFAATEIAVISLNATKLKARVEDGDKKAVKMLKMVEEPTGFLSTIQIGITLAGFLGSAFAADNFSDLLVNWLVNTCHITFLSPAALNSISVVVITLILSYFTLVLGELVPKRIAMRRSEKLASAFCGVITFLSKVLKPVIWFLTVSTNGVLRLFGIDPHEADEAVSQEDIVMMLDAGAEEGTIRPQEIEYIKNVFALDHLDASDVMTPRNSIELIADDAEEAEILNSIESSGYSRLPVYSETVDNIIGVLHTREYLLKRNTPGFTLEQAVLPVSFVPESIHLDALFKDMQMDHTHMVIVVDEYGGTAGLVTMEDILEELVGEIWDEQDEEIENFEKTGENTYKILCSTPIDEFFVFFGLEDEECDSSTVNGWILEQMGKIPDEKSSFEYKNLKITVTKADEQRTQEIRVTVKHVKTEETEDKGI